MATPTASWRPTVAEVANVIAQRTGDASGNAQGTFTTATSPSADQVDQLISQVQGEMIAVLGDVPALLATPPVAGGSPGSTSAGMCCAVGAASYVELQFYPDLQMGTAPIAEQLWQRYQIGLKHLREATMAIAAGGEIGAGQPANTTGSWAFPATTAQVPDGIPVTTWLERW